MRIGLFGKLAGLWLLMAPLALSAQEYPDYVSTTLNDFAGLLTEADAAALDARLSDLREETGVEMTVVTLERYDDYAPREDMSIEQFATGLFNHWGVGDASRNDGVMVLVARADRVMRIELGAAYGRDWDRAAADVIDDHFLPAFREDKYSRGILKGSQAAIEEIVMPFVGGESAPAGPNWFERNLDFLIFVVAGSVIAGFAGLGSFGHRLKRCPGCGNRGGLRRDRRVLNPASYSSTGMGRQVMTCTQCDYRNESEYVISRKSRSSSGGSFGGGSSGGGGASGRW